MEFISSSSGNNTIKNQNSADTLSGEGGWVYLIDKAKVIVDWTTPLESKWGKSEGQLPSDW